MKKAITKFLSLVMTFIMMISIIPMSNITAFAADVEPMTIEVTTDKSSYQTTGKAEITVTITNTSGDAVSNVCAEAVFEQLTPIKKNSNETYKEVDSLQPDESITLKYKAILNADKVKVSFFDKIGLWFTKLFSGSYTADNHNLNATIEKTTDIKFGKYVAKNVVKVSFDKAIVVENEWKYEVDDSHVVMIDENGNGYVDNRVVILFDTNDTNKINSVISSINGKVVGNFNGTYQVEVSSRNLEELTALCKSVEKLDSVSSAMCDYTYQISNEDDMTQSDASINDPWKNSAKDNEKEVWDESNPDGDNWWLETIEAISAWKYNDRFSKIKIGVVDSGFDTKHEDLNITVLNSSVNSADDHGTMVAGIIGATPNNSKGITGVVWNKELYGVDVKPTKKQTKQNISVHNVYQGIELAISKGCKTINFSMGLTEHPTKPNLDSYYKEAKVSINYILYWKKKYNREDFIIIQSAGNNGINSLRNGFFCSIKKETLESFYHEYQEKLDESFEDVLKVVDNFIIVGGVEKNGSKYKLYENLAGESNYGEAISISAPGEGILSLRATDKDSFPYLKESGTSLAAPIVTGVASLVWSINPSFSAKEVKEIVCSRTNKEAESNQSSKVDDRKYPIVNAKLAVEEALRRVNELDESENENKSSVHGSVIDKDTQEPISNMKVTLYSEDTQTTATTLTDENGDFSFENVVAGNYKVSFEHEEYVADASQSFIAAEGVVFVFLDPFEFEKKDSSGNEGGENTDPGEVVVASGACGEFGDNIKWTLHENGNLELIGEGKMSDYDSSDNKPQWNDVKHKITSISISDNITYIGGNAFRDCQNLEKVVFGKDVSFIGDFAFNNCNKLNDVDFNNSLRIVGKNAFEGCDVLPEISIPDSVSVIDSGAFEYCYNLSSINLPNTKMSIGQDAFLDTAYYQNTNNWENNVLYIGKHLIKSNESLAGEYSIKDGTITIAHSALAGTGLTKVSIPNSLQLIGYGSFAYCTNLGDVTLPNGIVEIEDYAFSGCYGFTNVVIPDSVEIIGNNAFYECVNVRTLHIGNSVETIGNEAFGRCTSLEGDLIIPDSVTTIGDNAFVCNNIKNIYIGNSVETIGKRAFSSPSQITSLTIPDSVKTIDDEAFMLCNKLENLYIGKNVTRIGDECFTFGKISEITIPASVEYIGELAFNYNPIERIIVDNDNKNYCSDETGVLFDKNKTTLIKFPSHGTTKKYNIPNTVTTISDYAFYGCDYLNSVTIPNGVTGIGNKSFCESDGIVEIIIPGSVVSIGQEAFYSCKSLSSVTIYYGVEEIGNFAFKGCEVLTTINIPDSVTSIGIEILDETDYYWKKANWTNGVMYIGNHLIDTENLSGEFIIKSGTKCIAGRALAGAQITDVVIPDSVVTIGYEAFLSCRNLKNVVLPNGVVTIEDSAFYDCTALESISIPNTVSKIGNQAFFGCDALDNVVIPDSVKSLGAASFYGCSSLTNVVIGEGISVIPQNAFAYCENLKSIVISYKVKTIESYAFYRCDNLKDVYYSGMKELWDDISIGSNNEKLKNATKHYNY